VSFLSIKKVTISFSSVIGLISISYAV